MIYAPREDSYLLAEQVKIYAMDKKVVDMGSGSGIQAISAKKFGAKEILAVDIDEEAFEHLKKIGFHAIRSDLFEKVKGRFDLIIFNPPYLPEDKEEDAESARITSGGKKGDEIIVKFLRESNKHLENEGIILLLISSLTPRTRINSLMKKLRYKHYIIAEKKMFMENLELWKIERV